MKNALCSLLLIGMVTVVNCQDAPNTKLDASFFAIIVEDFDTSLYWYSEVLHFEILSSQHVKEMGLKQANLSNGNTSIEIIELNSALDLKETMEGYNAKTRIIGLFKIGFAVDQFDKWIDFLEDKGVVSVDEVVMNPITKKNMIVFIDPDGNRIQLFEK